MKYLIFSVIYILSQSFVHGQKVYPVIGFEGGKSYKDSLGDQNIGNVLNSKLLDSLILQSLHNSLYLCYNDLDLSSSGLRRKVKNEFSKVILGVSVDKNIIYLPNPYISKTFASINNKNSLKMSFERYSDHMVYSSNKHSVHSDSLYLSSVPQIESKIQFDNSESDGTHIFINLEDINNLDLKIHIENQNHKNLYGTNNFKNAIVLICYVSEGMISFKYKGQYNSNGVFCGSFKVKNETKKKKTKATTKGNKKKS